MENAIQSIPERIEATPIPTIGKAGFLKKLKI